MRRRLGLGAAGALVFYVALQQLWPTPAGVVLQGVIVGSITALIAFGLALIYRSNQIINFAQADLGALPAVLMVTLVGGPQTQGVLDRIDSGPGWPYFVALPVALAAAAGLGWLVERFVIRPFAKAPRLILMVATIGLAQILAGLGTAIPFLLGASSPARRLRSPFDLDFTIDPIVFHGADVLAVVAVPLVVVALIAFLRYTPYGIAVRASAESSDRASLLGIDVRRVQSLVWVGTTVVAALAMILRSGVLGLPVGSAFGPSMLLRALAAAVIGRMENYGRMFAAAVAFGVVETAIVWNEDSAVLIDPAIFLIVIGFLLFQRRQRESRVTDQALSSWQVSSNVRPVPRELAHLPEVRWGMRAGGTLLLLVAVLLPFAMGDARTNLAAALFIFCIIAVSLVVLTGWAGEITLGQMSLVAVGAATAAAVNFHWQWDLVPTVFLAGLVGAAVALVIGLPALRVRGLFLAVSTLAFALATSSYLLNREYFGFLPDNLTERVERFPLFGRTDISSERTFYYVCLGTLLIVLWAARGLQRSRLRRVLIATRGNERTAQAFGLDLTRIRLTAFAVSGFIAAFAGGLFTFHQQALAQEPFAPAESLRVLTMAVIGGLGSIPGALLGAVFLKSTEWFNTIVSARYRFLFSFAGTGIGLLVVLRFLPGGLGALLYGVRDWLLRLVARRRGLHVPSLSATVARPSRPRWRRRPRPQPLEASSDAPLLSVRDIDVSYGPVQVLFDVSLDVQEGEMVALLGTNGAGKSTVLRAVSGLAPPGSGAILLDGRDISRLPPHRIVTEGVVQVPGGRGVFPSLTVDEHLALAAWPFRNERERVDAATERVFELFPTLREQRRSAAAMLSGGQQQMLALGMAFLGRPRLLMIDELSLGLAPVIVEQLLDFVRELNRQGVTVVLVEQSVNVALSAAQTGYFMEKGEVRFRGPTADLLDRPDLLRSVFLREGTAPSRRRVRQPGPTVLETNGLTKRFGGRVAIDGVSIQLHEAEILGVIGPNGAGKTTLFDLISGFLAADEGDIVFHGQRVDDLRPDQRVALGLGRSFQDARLFGDLTVAETLQVALDRRLDVKDPVAAALGLPDVIEAERTIADTADTLVELLGLGDFRDKFVAELSTGSRRIVDIACQFALEPRVLLFDEPSSGIAQRETEALAPFLRRIRDDAGTALLVIEHDMPLITEISDRIVALDLGRVVCDGDAGTVLRHPAVVASYLGADRAAIERSGPIRRRKESVP